MNVLTDYSNIQIFTVELIGTFILVVLATGTIVYDAQIGNVYGLQIAAAGPFAALIIGVYAFGKISMAHFNPAVTIAYYVTGHITRIQIAWYLLAEITGAVLGSLFVMKFIGIEANIGANAPNYSIQIPEMFAIEILASGLLMGVILCVVYTKGLRGFSGVAIGGIVALDILAFGDFSGASMNPARALAPAILSSATQDLWLYMSAPFIGTIAVAILYRYKFIKSSFNKRRHVTK